MRKPTRLDRYPTLWAALCLILVIALVGVTIGYLGNRHAGSVASCVNTNLGTRAAPSAADAKAHIAYAKAQDQVTRAQSATSKALLAVLLASPADQPAKYVAFLKSFKAGQVVVAKGQMAVSKYVHTLEVDQAERDKHPLGHC